MHSRKWRRLIAIALVVIPLATAAAMIVSAALGAPSAEGVVLIMWAYRQLMEAHRQLVRRPE